MFGRQLGVLTNVTAKYLSLPRFVQQQQSQFVHTTPYLSIDAAGIAGLKKSKDNKHKYRMSDLSKDGEVQYDKRKVRHAFVFQFKRLLCCRRKVNVCMSTVWNS